MTIFRVKHNQNYSVINNTINFDNRLTMKAKGIWMYAFSRPDDWQFHLNDIVNQCVDGEKAIKSGLRELEECGYLQRVQEKDKQGRFEKVEWCFYETPRELKEKVPQACFGPAENRPAVKDSLLSTDIISTEKTTVCVEGGPVAPPPLRNHEKIVLKTFEKTDIEVCKNDLILAAVQRRKDWTPQELDEAWLVLANYQGPVRDWVLFCEGTIMNKRKLSALKKFNVKEKKEICKEKSSSQKEESDANKNDSSDPASWGRPLANWKSRLGLEKE